MVYVDLLVIQDLIYNYVILLGVGVILTRVTNFRKIFLGSVVGLIPLIFIFTDIDRSVNLIISFIFSLIMVVIAFSYKDIIYTIKNILYMYFVSIFLAGSINLIGVNFLMNMDSYLLNIVVLIMIAPIITYVYIKSIKSFKESYSNYYDVSIYLKDNNNIDKEIRVSAFLDTGNKLMDPYKYRPVILLRSDLVDTLNYKILLVPYNTINTNDLLRCIVPVKIKIDGIGERGNFLVGLMDEINIDGIDCILNSKLLD